MKIKIVFANINIKMTQRKMTGKWKLNGKSTAVTYDLKLFYGTTFL